MKLGCLSKTGNFAAHMMGRMRQGHPYRQDKDALDWVVGYAPVKKMSGGGVTFLAEQGANPRNGGPDLIRCGAAHMVARCHRSFQGQNLEHISFNQWGKLA